VQRLRVKPWRRKLKSSAGLEEGFNGLSGEDRSKRVQTLSEAADELLRDYPLRSRPNSVRYLKQRLAHLIAHMGGMMLIEITPDIIAAYQAIRLKEGALGSTINAEVMFALRLMGEIGDAVRLRLKRERRIRLPKNKNCGKALTPEEEAALLQAARVPEVIEGAKVDLKATRSPAIRPAIMLALKTTMRISEIRTLRWKQIDFLKRIIEVGESKTDAGTGRRIPINDELFSTLAEHKAWYETNVCRVDSQLYVFPFGDCRKYHPERPISSFKTSWANVRDKAGVGIRFHDLRYTAITKLAESGAPDETILAIAGHISREMLSHYSHIRTEAKRRALEAISTRPEPAAVRAQTRKAAS
jgi:integrase